jgi:hypothetical protein
MSLVSSEGLAELCVLDATAVRERPSKPTVTAAEEYRPSSAVASGILTGGLATGAELLEGFRTMNLLDASGELKKHPGE